LIFDHGIEICRLGLQDGISMNLVLELRSIAADLFRGKAVPVGPRTLGLDERAWGEFRECDRLCPGSGGILQFEVGRRAKTDRIVQDDQRVRIWASRHIAPDLHFGGRAARPRKNGYGKRQTGRTKNEFSHEASSGNGGPESVGESQAERKITRCF